MTKQNYKNEQVTQLVSELKKLSIEKKSNIWKRIAEDLEKPTRDKRIINIYKLAKYSKENDTVIVPGKVLGTGELMHKLNVAAFQFSTEAQKKISEKGKCLTIQELMKQNPDGKHVKILG
jgi:large subunit ribosomal protein L18e